MRPEQQKHQGQHVGKPDLDAAPHVGAQEHFGQFFTHTNDQAADDGAGYRGEAAKYDHRQGTQRHGGERKLHTQLAAPNHASHQRHHPGHAPDDDPNAVEWNTNALRRLVVVGHRTQGAAGGGFLEEKA